MKMSNKELWLAHYSSKYYDPVAASEYNKRYYEEHKKLKGRSTSKLNDEGKEVWQETKSNIETEKKQKIEEEKTELDEKIEELRTKAEAEKERISEKLTTLNEILSRNEKSKKKQISASKEARVEALRNRKPPSGLSDEEKANWYARQKREIARIQGNAQDETESVSEETKKSKTENSNNAKADRKVVANQLKASITAAREAYKKAVTDINSSYEDIFQNEYDAILSEYQKASTTKSTKSSGTSKESSTSTYVASKKTNKQRLKLH